MTRIHEVARQNHPGARPAAGAFSITSQKITVEGFLNEFVRRDKQMADRPFCWILASGASFQSGIPTGGTLVLQWLRELHEVVVHERRVTDYQNQFEDLAASLRKPADNADADWLEKLAAVINDVAPAESLDAWPAWRKAADAS